MDVVAGGGDAVRLPQPQPSAEDGRDYRDMAVPAFPTPEGDSGEDGVPVRLVFGRTPRPRRSPDAFRPETTCHVIRYKWSPGCDARDGGIAGCKATNHSASTHGGGGSG